MLRSQKASVDKFELKNPTFHLLRWRLKLAEYDYKIIYKIGKTNTDTGALSRNTADPLLLFVNSEHRKWTSQIRNLTL